MGQPFGAVVFAEERATAFVGFIYQFTVRITKHGNGAGIDDFRDAQFVGQGEDDDRSIEETLNLAWDLLSVLPPDALARVSEADIKKYYNAEANAAES